MRNRTFAELMRDPAEFFELQADLVRRHYAHLSGHGPSVDKDAMATQPTGSRTMPTPQASPCPVTVLATRRKPS